MQATDSLLARITVNPGVMAGKPTIRLETLLKVLQALGGSLAVEGLA